jgi:ABC-2 type transport system ATP-binding protein
MRANAVLPTFELRQVCKRFGAVTVLDQVSLEFAPGQRHALLGPNGSGKTTLLRVLAGRVAVDSGEATCQGVSFKTSTPRSRPDIRYLTQHFSSYGDLTVRENLDFSASIRGILNRAQAVERALAEFDLRAEQAQRAGTLSGGVRQRLMLAAVLLGEPQILLLDEPTAALDSESRAMLWYILDRRRTSATTVVVTTHLDADAARCENATYLRGGRVVPTDPASVMP